MDLSAGLYQTRKISIIYISLPGSFSKTNPNKTLNSLDSLSQLLRRRSTAPLFLSIAAVRLCLSLSPSSPFDCVPLSLSIVVVSSAVSRRRVICCVTTRTSPSPSLTVVSKASNCGASITRTSPSSLSTRTSPSSLSQIKMALRGVWQLEKLVVSYCNWGGSSRGIRAFMESHLPALRESNPQLEVVTELVRGQHPHLKGCYKNKNERVVCVKNLTPEEILLHATRLRNALGRKVVKLRTRHVTKHPSVQGTWTTDVKF